LLYVIINQFPKLNLRFPGTTYESILSDLQTKDRRLYTENGMINMLERNRRIKARPQRFVEALDGEEGKSSLARYDVVLTCEEKCYDLVVENFEDMGHRVR
jgi:RNA polymerase II subunit A C-terminal domain phosphatase SSU72